MPFAKSLSMTLVVLFCSIPATVGAEEISFQTFAQSDLPPFSTGASLPKFDTSLGALEAVIFGVELESQIDAFVTDPNNLTSTLSGSQFGTFAVGGLSGAFQLAGTATFTQENSIDFGNGFFLNLLSITGNVLEQSSDPSILNSFRAASADEVIDVSLQYDVYTVTSSEPLQSAVAGGGGLVFSAPITVTYRFSAVPEPSCPLLAIVACVLSLLSRRRDSLNLVACGIDIDSASANNSAVLR